MSEYYYNSVKLPILPEWDKSVYPKVIIYYRQATPTSPILTCLLCYSAVEDPGGYCDADNREYFTINFPALRSVYDENTNSWGTLEHSDDAYPEYTGISISMGELIWSNHDIVLDYTLLGKNHSDQFLASDPIPVTPSNPFCLRSWLTGFALGLAGKTYPYSAPVPVAYLYNGVRLPALPEWDRTVYPYTYIWQSASDQSYHLTCSSVPIIVYGADEYYLSSADSEPFIAYRFQNNIWEYWYQSTTSTSATIQIANALSKRSLIWANYDISREDDTVYLAGSDPVPVYE